LCENLLYGFAHFLMIRLICRNPNKKEPFLKYCVNEFYVVSIVFQLP